MSTASRTIDSQPYHEISVAPLTPTIGAEISGVDLRESIGPETLRELRRALLEHLVIFLHGQDLSDEQHVQAAASFGTPNVYPVTRARGIEQPLEFIGDSSESPPKADLWHTDAAFLEEPPDLAMINLRDLPPSGGDTLWCSLYEAYDALSPAMRDVADALEQDLHPGDYFKKSVELQFGPGIYEKVAEEHKGARHPLVRVHPETGRRALFLCGAYVRGIAGMHPDESTLLYEFFRSRLADPNLQCRWRWQEHDVAIWDERCTNHRALSDHYPSQRMLRRCTMGAGRPEGPRA
jgi:taurine dioxygenase